jgi:hypothetical protein
MPWTVSDSAGPQDMTGSSANLTLAGTATAGALLYVLATNFSFADDSGEVLDTPTGFTSLYGTNAGHFVAFWKVSDGTETTVTITRASGSLTWRLYLWEFLNAARTISDVIQAGGVESFSESVSPYDHDPNTSSYWDGTEDLAIFTDLVRLPTSARTLDVHTIAEDYTSWFGGLGDGGLGTGPGYSTQMWYTPTIPTKVFHVVGAPVTIDLELSGTGGYFYLMAVTAVRTEPVSSDTMADGDGIWGVFLDAEA